MKRKLLLLAAVLITISMVGYGTLTYFTTSGTANNVITAGNIKLRLSEKNADGIDIPQGEIADIMPGTTVDRIVTVTNTGNNSFYLRIKLDKIIKPAEGVTKTLNFDDILLDIDTAHWALGGDGYYYYTIPLDPGKVTPALFTAVSFSKEMGNVYMDAHVEINVSAQAVQTANNGQSVSEAVGWPS